MRTNKNSIIELVKSGLSKLLYALRTGQKADGKSHFEELYGRKPNPVKNNVAERNKNVSEKEAKLTFSPPDFEEEIELATQVRERTKGSKVEGQTVQEKGVEGAKRNSTQRLRDVPYAGKRRRQRNNLNIKER